MVFRTVLGIAGIDQGNDDVSVALDLCEEADAHLSLLLLGIAPPPLVSDYAINLSDAWIEEREEDISRLSARVEALKAVLAQRAVSADLMSEYVEAERAAKVIGRRALYSDVALLGPEMLSTINLKRAIADGVLFHAQRPLLLIPTNRKVTLKPRKIVIGWNGSLEAARAVREATDIIANADDVRIVMVDPQSTGPADGAEPGTDIAAYLARHRAKITIDRLPSAGLSVAEVLKRHAMDIAADLIIIGAYGHTRLRERIFGGVTQTMIETSPDYPIFMAR